MRFVMFYHSLVSDWNHGNAHFLRGVVTELMARGHTVDVYEPARGWSLENLRREQGEQPLAEFAERFPELVPRFYEAAQFDFDRALDGADVVLVHEWNDPELIARLGRLRSREPSFRLFFHDTHHRAISEPAKIAALDLSDYDGVLAYGRSIRDEYLRRGWAGRCWVWHEAADTRRFYPHPSPERQGDLVWIGNWGDGERSRELRDYLLGPAAELGLSGRVYGVRYPAAALDELQLAGLEFSGWLPNYRVPEVFGQFSATVHVPRGPYREELRGIPTIRVFEALACGIPLVSAPWDDSEQLFTVGEDFLLARSPGQMRTFLNSVVHDADFAAALAARGLKTIRARHTCAHRVDELLALVRELDPDQPLRGPAPQHDAAPLASQDRSTRWQETPL